MSDIEPVDAGPPEPHVHQASRGVGREALVYALSVAIGGACSFTSVYLFTRLLPPNEMGVYATVIAASELLTNLGFGWINLTMMREYPAHGPGERAGFLGRIIAAQLWVSLLVALGCVGFALFKGVNSSDGADALLTLLLVVGNALLSFTQWTFRLQHRAADWTFSSIFFALSRLGLGWLLLEHWRANGHSLLIAQVLAVAIAAALGLLRWREKVEIGKASFGWQAIKPILSYGLPLTFVGTGQNIMARSAMLILGALRGKAEVGLFYSSYQLCYSLLVLPYQPMELAISPQSYQVLEQHGPKMAARFMYHASALMLQVMGAAAVVIMLLRGAIVGSLMDSAYAGAGGPLLILAPAVLLIFMQSMLRRGYEFSRRTLELAYLTAAMVALNMGLAALGGWLWSMQGVSLALLVTYLIFCVASYLGAQRQFAWPLPLRQALLMLPPAAVLIVLDHFLPHAKGIVGVALSVVAYMTIFVGLMLLTLRFGGRAGREHLAFMLSLFQRRA